MNAARTNPFLHFTKLGYGTERLLPIIPPGAEVHPESSLHKRLEKSGDDARGKTPGVKTQNGLWVGFNWITYRADELDLERWSRMGAGVGIRTGDGLHAIDADTLSPENAATIRDVVRKHIGETPIRVGRYPKALYLVRCSEPYAYTRVDFGDRRPNGSYIDRVEILGDKKQFVAFGVHPGTLKPYTWPRALVPFDDLPIVSAAALDAMMAELRSVLPASAEKIVREGENADRNVNQEALRGPLEAVRKAVETTPNTSAHFPTREAYRDWGYAIKAALPDDEPDAKALFLDWCARWKEGDNDPDVAEADWARMKPPFRRGAGYLFEIAEAATNGAFRQTDVWFAPLPDEILSPFAAAEQAASSKEAGDVYPLLTVDEIMTRPPPVYLVARHIPQQAVGFVYSEPGVGKSFLTLDLSLHIATGAKDWHGAAIDAGESPAVLYIASEGSFDLKNRIAAWLAHHKMTPDRAKSFFVIEKTIDFMDSQDVQRLVRTVRGAAAAHGVRFALVVVDTVSRAMPGADENLQKEMTLFVAACDRVRDAFACAVVGVHHAGKSGDMRGSTVLLGAGDFVFRLTRRRGATVGTLACEKMKSAADGWEEPYRFDTVEIGDGQTSLVVAREEAGIGPTRELTPDVAGRVLRAMDVAWHAGAPWSKAPQAGERRAVRRMVEDFGFDAVGADELVGLWERMGTIRVALASSVTKLRGFQVMAVPDNLSEPDGIFG